MAYMSQELKKKIAAELKKVIPKSWKYSLGVKHHSTIVLTVKSAPVLIDGTDYTVNPYWIHQKKIKLMDDIVKALNLENHNRSRPEIDHHDVGYYLDFRFGKWDKPFVSTGSDVDLREPEKRR